MTCCFFFIFVFTLVLAVTFANVLRRLLLAFFFCFCLVCRASWRHRACRRVVAAAAVVDVAFCLFDF